MNKGKDKTTQFAEIFNKVFGFIVLILGIAILVVIERFTAQMTDHFSDVAKIFAGTVDASKADPSLDNKMVYLDADMTIEDAVEDPLYRVGGDYVTVLRDVEYFQWTESSEEVEAPRSHREKSSSDVEEKPKMKTEYHYSLDWMSDPINSKKFHQSSQHENTTLIQIPKKNTYNPTAKIGAYRMGQKLQYEYWALGNERIPIDASDQFSREKTEVAGTSIPVHVTNNMIYYGNNPNSPQVGDVRVMFFANRPSHVYVLTKVEGDSLCPYFMKEASKQYAEIKKEPFDASAMLTQKTKSYGDFAIYVRILGWLLTLWGVHLLRSLLVDPIVRNKDSKLLHWIVCVVLATVILVACHYIGKGLA